MRRQFAWIELYHGEWCFLPDILIKPANASCRWKDKKQAITELGREGWNISDSYQNKLSRKLGLPTNVHGFGLTRTIH